MANKLIAGKKNYFKVDNYVMEVFQDDYSELEQFLYEYDGVNVIDKISLECRQLMFYLSQKALDALEKRLCDYVLERYDVVVKKNEYLQTPDTVVVTSKKIGVPREYRLDKYELFQHYDLIKYGIQKVLDKEAQRYVVLPYMRDKGYRKSGDWDLEKFEMFAKDVGIQYDDIYRRFETERYQAIIDCAAASDDGGLEEVEREVKEIVRQYEAREVFQYQLYKYNAEKKGIGSARTGFLGTGTNKMFVSLVASGWIEDFDEIVPLGVYECVQDCLVANQKMFGIEIEEVPNFKDRVHIVKKK